MPTTIDERTHYQQMIQSELETFRGLQHYQPHLIEITPDFMISDGVEYLIEHYEGDALVEFIGCSQRDPVLNDEQGRALTQSWSFEIQHLTCLICCRVQQQLMSRDKVRLQEPLPLDTYQLWVSSICSEVNDTGYRVLMLPSEYEG